MTFHCDDAGFELPDFAQQVGTEVIATIPKYVTFTQGREVLACMSLTEKGLLRWYAGCCNTAIVNTSRDFKVPHVGLVHTCLQDPAVSLESAFGPIRMRVNTKSAKGKVDSNLVGTFVAVVRFLKSQLRARLNGNYRHTPFFVSENGAPVVHPVVLTITERERLQ